MELIKSSLINEPTTLLLINRSTCDTDHFKIEYQKQANQNELNIISVICNIGADQSFTFLGQFEADRTMLFNNAGVLGKLEYIKDLTAKEISDAITTNLIGTLSLTSKVIKLFPKTTIVNISSLAALQPFETWSLYATCKAGLDMFHKSIALENPDCRVLNYAPGPLDTRMQHEIRTKMPDCALKIQFIDLNTNKKLIQPKDSAQKLVMLLAQNEFDNGAHVDFYDI